jgi:hypothetical protein
MARCTGLMKDRRIFGIHLFEDERDKFEKDDDMVTIAASEEGNDSN